jgi:hemolysin activation/secretion protein
MQKYSRRNTFFGCFLIVPVGVALRCEQAGTFLALCEIRRKPASRLREALHLIIATLGLCSSLDTFGASQPLPAKQLLQQQEREKALRQQLQPLPSVHLKQPSSSLENNRLPKSEAHCLVIRRITLRGDFAESMQWALRAAEPQGDPASGRCLGTAGINLTMKRIQNAIIERGYITSRVIAAPQDLGSGTLQLTLIPGRIRSIRFAADSAAHAVLSNALPGKPGDLLNLRDIEQALENFERLPSVKANIQIIPAEDALAGPGESDLLITWQQALPLRFSMSLNDSGTEDTGKYLGTTSTSIDNPFNINDLLYFSYSHDVENSHSRGAKGYSVHYSLPYQYWLLDLTLSRYRYLQKISGTNQDYRYRGNSQSDEISLSRVLYRDAMRKTSARLGLWSRRSANFLDDTEITMQRRRTSGWEMAVMHNEFFANASLYLNASYRRGTGARNSLPAPEQAFSQGTSRAKIINLEARLDVPFSLCRQRLRYTGTWLAQYNQTSLTASDRFTIGGRYSVRGFDGEQFLAADRGWLLRNDLALALGQSGLESYLGLDYGEVAGQASSYLSGTHLAGYVLGLRADYKNLAYDLFLGQPISKPRGFDSAATTSGVSLTWSF